MSRRFLYFTLAALPVLLSADHAPVDAWAWFKWAALGFYNGLLAIKALQSPAPLPDVVPKPVLPALPTGSGTSNP